MKLFTTIENEILLSVDQNAEIMEIHRLSRLLRPPGSRETEGNPKAAAFSVPGAQVINNILNYAKSLEVLKPSGKSIFLIGN